MNDQATSVNPVPTIEVKDLVIDFSLNSSIFNPKFLRASNEVSFVLKSGEALAIVGESGSGKSTCVRAICRLYDATSGSIKVDGTEINSPDNPWSQREYASKVQMIFQDPFGSLNPVHTIRHHLARPVRIHHPGISAEDTETKVIEILERVGLAPAKQTADKYPYEISGGQRQRVAIARALAVGAKFILADEPISMLDVSIRLGILNLMDDMKKEGIGFMYITHDIATARYFAERTAVMYVGHMVEWGNSDNVTQNPQHPYTQLLISAVPEAGIRTKREVMAKKADIPVRTPDSVGCPFAERCLKAMDQCQSQMPPVKQLGDDHFVRCFLYE